MGPVTTPMLVFQSVSCLGVHDRCARCAADVCSGTVGKPSL